MNCIVKKDFTSAQQVKNTLQDVGRNVSLTVIKRPLYDQKFKGLTARFKPLKTLKNTKDKASVCKNTQKEAFRFVEKKFYGLMKQTQLLSK